jgi:hypothetical protein
MTKSYVNFYGMHPKPVLCYKDLKREEGNKITSVLEEEHFESTGGKFKPATKVVKSRNLTQ